MYPDSQAGLAATAFVIERHIDVIKPRQNARHGLNALGRFRAVDPNAYACARACAVINIRPRRPTRGRGREEAALIVRALKNGCVRWRTPNSFRIIDAKKVGHRIATRRAAGILRGSRVEGLGIVGIFVGGVDDPVSRVVVRPTAREFQRAFDDGGADEVRLRDQFLARLIGYLRGNAARIVPGHRKAERSEKRDGDEDIDEHGAAFIAQKRTGPFPKKESRIPFL